MLGYDWFSLVLVSYLDFHNMNYLRFTYFDLIPNKRPFTVSKQEYNEAYNKLKKPFQFKLWPLEASGMFLGFIILIYCIPLTFYILFLGNFPPQSEDFLVMQYTPYIIILVNAFFIIGGLFVCNKIPRANQTIPAELYTIPPKYLDILLRMHPNNRNIIAELQNRTNLESSTIINR